MVKIEIEILHDHSEGMGRKSVGLDVQAISGNHGACPDEIAIAKQILQVLRFTTDPKLANKTLLVVDNDKIEQKLKEIGIHKEDTKELPPIELDERVVGVMDLEEESNLYKVPPKDKLN